MNASDDLSLIQAHWTITEMSLKFCLCDGLKAPLWKSSLSSVVLLSSCIIVFIPVCNGRIISKIDSRIQIAFRGLGKLGQVSIDENYWRPIRV